MKANETWFNQPKEFWDYVRVLSQDLGYTKDRKTKILRHAPADVEQALDSSGLSLQALETAPIPGLTIEALVEYFDFRANLIEGEITDNLQTAEQAKQTFEQVVANYTSTYTSRINKDGEESTRNYLVSGGVAVSVPFNKQKDKKRYPDYLTGTANILFSHYLGGEGFDQDPQKVPVMTQDGVVVGSMGRRMDGGYPATVNPVAVWEFKCYYYTTSFGSKVSDAVYITSLDGREQDDINEKFEELKSPRRLQSVLFIDAYDPWRFQGPQYLCRLVDLLHQGVMNEIVVGREVLTAVPRLVEEWKKLPK